MPEPLRYPFLASEKELKQNLDSFEVLKRATNGFLDFTPDFALNVTRIQHLAELSQRRAAAGQKPFEVVACIDGRGFGVRRSDLRKLLLATRGKVFTLATLDHLIPHTQLQKFATDSPQ